MFEQSGESFGEIGGEHCGGVEGCLFYYQTAGDTEAERHVAAQMQCGKKCLPPLNESEAAENAEIEKEVENLVEEVADLIFWADTGDRTEWPLYPFETRQLFGIWREAEKQVVRIQQGRMQMFIKSFAGEAK